MAILDIHGKPIRNADIPRDRQTARIAQLQHDFAEHPSVGLTPARLAALLEDAERGDIAAQAELMEDMEEKDGHIYAEMQKRRRAILTLPWRIIPAPGGGRRAERLAALAEELIQAIEIEDLLMHLTDAIGKGFAAVEVAPWRRLGAMLVPGEPRFVPQRLFRLPDDPLDETIRLRDGTKDGQDLAPLAWIVHTHRTRSGHLSRAGLYRILAWPFLFKNYAVRDLAEFLEIYGLPLRLGTYPAGASDEEKSTLLRAVTSIGHLAAGIIPEGMAIEFKEAAKGTSDPFEAMIAWAERTVSKAVLGATLTSQVDHAGGNRALGEVHMDVMRDLIASDARQIAKTLTQALIWPLVAVNVPGADPALAPRFEFDTQEADDLALYADAIPKLAMSGVRIPERWVRERLQIPEPEADEPVIGGERPAPQAAASLAAPLETPTCPVCAASAAPEQNADTARRDRLGEAMQPELDAWIERARQEMITLAEQGADLAELGRRLERLLPELDTTRATEILSEAFTAALAAGVYDAGQN